jgi:hypothetical protein
MRERGGHMHGAEFSFKYKTAVYTEKNLEGSFLIKKKNADFDTVFKDWSD